MLEKIGYLAVTVDSAEEAEHILRSGENFSIIITDLKMPWLNGLNFCRNVKIFHPDLKIYALSGYIYDFDINDPIFQDSSLIMLMMALTVSISFLISATGLSSRTPMSSGKTAFSAR